VQALKWLFTSRVIDVTSYYLLKLSIAGQLLRLTTRRAYLCLIYQVTVVLTIIQLLDYIFLFSKCAPLARVWDPSVSGTCWKTQSVLIGAYVENSEDANSPLNISMLLTSLSHRCIDRLELRRYANCSSLGKVKPIFSKYLLIKAEHISPQAQEACGSWIISSRGIVSKIYCQTHGPMET